MNDEGMRLLIVETEAELARILGAWIRSKEFVIDQVGTLAEARLAVFRVAYDLIVLDLSPSDGSDLRAMAELRRINPTAVILTVSPKDRVDVQGDGIYGGEERFR